MKHLKKFEELKFSTYMSAADKLDSFGQKKRADELRKHAHNMISKDIKEMTFSILVGDVREFPEAKFQSMSLFKTSDTFLIQTIFTSNEYTHRITSKLQYDGQIFWHDGNKFTNKKSAVNFEKVIKILSGIQDDFAQFFDTTGLTSNDLSLVYRTFYV